MRLSQFAPLPPPVPPDFTGPFPRARTLLEKSAAHSPLRLVVRAMRAGADSWLKLATATGYSVAKIRGLLKLLGRGVQIETLRRSSLPGSSHARIILAPDLDKWVALLDYTRVPPHPLKPMDVSTFCEENLDLLADYQSHIHHEYHSRVAGRLSFAFPLALAAGHDNLLSISTFTGFDPKNYLHRGRLKRVAALLEQKFELVSFHYNHFKLNPDRRLLLPLVWPRLSWKVRHDTLQRHPDAENIVQNIYNVNL